MCFLCLSTAIETLNLHKSNVHSADFLSHFVGLKVKKKSIFAMDDLMSDVRRWTVTSVKVQQDFWSLFEKIQLTTQSAY